MNDKVDVLAVMELAYRNLNGGTDSLSTAEFVAAHAGMKEARAAVGELIEAIEAERSVYFEKHVHLMYAKIRTNAALARVKGE